MYEAEGHERYEDEDGYYWIGARGVGVGAAWHVHKNADPRTVIEEIAYDENIGLGMKVTVMFIEMLGPKNEDDHP